MHAASATIPALLRLVSTNLQDVRPDRLPPPRREGPVRMLFIHGNILGFKNVAAQLKHYSAEREDVDAVHIDLVAPTWLKVLGKSIPFLHGGRDFHAERYLHAWGWIIARWFRNELPLERFDVVHMMTQTNAYAMLQFPGRAKFAVNIDSTTVQEIEEFGFPAPMKMHYLQAERRMFSAADLVVTRNAWASRCLGSHYNLPESSIHVAHNSLAAPPHHRGEAGRDHDGPVRFAFVGNNWLRKGGDLVLAAHQASVADRAELHVFGDRVDRDDSARNVIWHGRVARDQLIDELLPSMDAFVIASRFDMLPWAALEGAGAGLPLLAPNVGGIPEIAVDGETGVLFEVGDEEGIAAGMKTLCDDAALRRRLGEAARERLQTQFDPAVTYQGLLDRLCGLVDGGGG